MPTNNAPITHNDQLEQLLAQFNVSQDMFHRLQQKFVGFRVHIILPCSGKTGIDPTVVGVDTEAVDDNIELGHMATLPKWITNVGKSLSGQAYKTVRRFATPVPSVGGYMVNEQRVEELETILLSLKGITDEDRGIYSRSMVDEAERQIRLRRERLSEEERQRQTPVTFLDYCSYLYDHYDELTEEIKAAYQEKGYVIDSYLPTQESLKSFTFEWFRYAQLPSLMMFGETSLRQILADRRREQGNDRQMQRQMQRQIEQLEAQCTDVVNSVQKRVREDVVQELQKLATRLAKSPVTDAEREEARQRGERVVDTSRVTENSLQQLQHRLQELLSDSNQINSTDDFSNAMRSLSYSIAPHRAGALRNEDSRADVLEQLQETIELAMDDDTINTNTGEFFRSML